MCAINPKHKKRFIIDVYTSHPTMDVREFEGTTCQALLDTELRLNTEFPQLRFHLKESTEQAE